MFKPPPNNEKEPLLVVQYIWNMLNTSHSFSNLNMELVFIHMKSCVSVSHTQCLGTYALIGSESCGLILKNTQ